MAGLGGDSVIDTQIPQSPQQPAESKLPDIKKPKRDPKRKKRMLKSKSSTEFNDSFIPKSVSPTQRGSVVSLRKLASKQKGSKTILASPQEQLEQLRSMR